MYAFRLPHVLERCAWQTTVARALVYVFFPHSSPPVSGLYVCVRLGYVAVVGRGGTSSAPPTHAGRLTRHAGVDSWRGGRPGTYSNNYAGATPEGNRDKRDDQQKTLSAQTSWKLSG